VPVVNTIVEPHYSPWPDGRVVVTRNGNLLHSRLAAPLRIVPGYNGQPESYELVRRISTEKNALVLTGLATFRVVRKYPNHFLFADHRLTKRRPTRPLC
jgi:hypothetical protein